MHIEKNGGSSIECASQHWHNKGWWTNMGHTSHNDVRGCVESCNVPTARVLVVRDPYTYWQARSTAPHARAHACPARMELPRLPTRTALTRTPRRDQSVFKYAWLEGAPSYVSWWLGQNTNEHSTQDRRRGHLRSFGHFMRWVGGDGDKEMRHISQSARVHRACGTPCRYERLLHVENLTDSWAALLNAYNMPHVQLPRLNEATANHRQEMPDYTLTDEIVEVIHRLDDAMFSEFGYARRAGFEP